MNLLIKNVDVTLLRRQRNKLLEFINPSEELIGLINLLDNMLDIAEERIHP